MSGVTVATAFLGGLLALLSPCSALLLPAFFAYSFTTRTRLSLRTAVFYAGLITTLVPLGVAGSFASRLFYGHRDLLVAVGGWTMIGLGLAQILGVGFGSRRLQQAAGSRGAGSALSVFALGTVYGLAGFCAGPILGGILTVAALDGSPVHGGLLLAVYALGLAVPMFVLALLWDRYDLGRRRWLRGRAMRLGPLTVHSTSLVGGLVFVLLGVVFLLFDGTSALPSLLDIDTQAAWEDGAVRLGKAVSDRALLLVVALAGAAMAVTAAVRLRRLPAEEPQEESDSAV
ncbi:sulfite exporter TauE/SafE family protein [Streptomyces sp. RY43-2]|uniref:Sulfite exporter TauE/SafE family protein n=1 Tax=Streptomyces macrolidinus TaxID=2952607 RepID=A0ABT0ZIM9_9ACTN|nr:cytochrome c biogenesis protein CcdA [Streptomyces macrolidinus]MCN9243444.1 sulfite exporter TauE/SafE family protein [Streptomyces macrolidinus]